MPFRWDAIPGEKSRYTAVGLHEQDRITGPSSRSGASPPGRQLLLVERGPISVLVLESNPGAPRVATAYPETDHARSQGMKIQLDVPAGTVLDVETSG